MAKACLVFVHIPKAAGQTLNRILRREYKRSETIEFNTLDKPLDEFESVPIEERDRARLVRGHVHYGIHRLIPQDTKYITILRDPVHRVLSLYGYILREPRHPLHDQLTASRMGLEEFIQAGVDSTQVENGQTRQIAGVQQRDPTRADLERAVSNLRGFLVVGLVEQFDESAILMKRMLGWRTPFYVSQNVGGGAGNGREISHQALNLIREKNVLDLELFSEANRLFHERIARQDASFSREVARFKKLNQVSQALGSRVNPALNRVKYSATVNRLRRIAR